MKKHSPLKGGREIQDKDAVLVAINSSVAFDHRLALQDARGSLAHVSMLARQGIITDTEGQEITAGLLRIRELVSSGEFVSSAAREDVHMNIEGHLADDIGRVAGKLHTARSRNDQVATDFRLWIRDASDILTRKIAVLIDALLVQAEQHAATVMPGFTHLQCAQPITFGHHCMAYAEMFSRDRIRLVDARRRMNECPLGAAALAGTSFPIDREYVAHQLGFARPMANSLDCVADRDFAIDFLGCIATLSVHLSRLAEELVLWTTAQFGYVALPEELTTGSSIMPQKRNVDAAELIRGKAGRMIGNLNALLITMKGLPLSYSKDMQEDKEAAFDSFDSATLCLDAMALMISRMKVNVERMLQDASSGFSTATDVADWLVREMGFPFREAHHVVGKLVTLAETRKCELADLPKEDIAAVDPRLSERAWPIFDAQASVRSRNSFGGTAPACVLAAIEEFRRRKSELAIPSGSILWA